MLEAIEQFDNFALRKGETVVRGWSLGERAAKNILKNPRMPEANDLVPNIEQKGVDLRIGLDIARLSLRQIVQRSEEHTSELQSLMRISYAVFCLKKKNKT